MGDSFPSNPSPLLSPSGSTPRAAGLSRMHHLRHRSFSVSSEAGVQEDITIPLSDWIPRIMKQHPDVLELRETLRSILGLPSFGSLSAESSSRTEVSDTIDPDMILRLIDQFLLEFGFTKASSVLRRESMVFQSTNHAVLSESYLEGDLQKLIRLGITPEVFDPADSTDGDPELEAMIDGISIAEIDVNIWNEPSSIGSSALQQAHFLSHSANQMAAQQRNLVLERSSGEEETSTSLTITPNNASTHMVKGATLNQLVVWLLVNANDLPFRQVFFATLHSFTTPQQFIMKVEQRYTTPSHLPKLEPIELQNIATTLTYWISNHGHELSSRVYTMLNKFLENTFVRDGHSFIAESLQKEFTKMAAIRAVRSNRTRTNPTAPPPPLPSPVSTSSNNASNPIIVMDNLKKTPSSPVGPPGSPTSQLIPNAPEPKVPKNIFEATLSLDDVDEEEIARQITCLDNEPFRLLKSQELLKNTWIKTRGKKAKRVVRLMNGSNALTKWVIDSIISVAIASSAPASSGGVSVNFGASGITPGFYSTGGSTSPSSSSSGVSLANSKKVTKVITRWIKLGEHLKSLYNFHSLLAIWSGLKSKQIFPLVESSKKDISRSHAEALVAWDALFHSGDSYGKYRSIIANLNVPCVPALAIHLRDLSLIEEAQLDHLRSQKHLINFQKRRMLYNALKSLLRHQQTPNYNLLLVYQVSDRIASKLMTHFNALQAEKPGGQFDYSVS